MDSDNLIRCIRRTYRIQLGAQCGLVILFNIPQHRWVGRNKRSRGWLSSNWWWSKVALQGKEKLEIFILFTVYPQNLVLPLFEDEYPHFLLGTKI
jgi:hypothetical protein